MCVCVFKTEASDQNVKPLSLSSELVTEVVLVHALRIGGEMLARRVMMKPPVHSHCTSFCWQRQRQPFRRRAGDRPWA